MTEGHSVSTARRSAGVPSSRGTPAGSGGWTREGPGYPVDNGFRARRRRDGSGPKGSPGPLPVPRADVLTAGRGRPCGAAAGPAPPAAGRCGRRRDRRWRGSARRTGRWRRAGTRRGSAPGSTTMTTSNSRPLAAVTVSTATGASSAAGPGPATAPSTSAVTQRADLGGDRDGARSPRAARPRPPPRRRSRAARTGRRRGPPTASRRSPAPTRGRAGRGRRGRARPRRPP